MGRSRSIDLVAPHGEEAIDDGRAAAELEKAQELDRLVGRALEVEACPGEFGPVERGDGAAAENQCRADETAIDELDTVNLYPLRAEGPTPNDPHIRLSGVLSLDGAMVAALHAGVMPDQAVTQ